MFGVVPARFVHAGEAHTAKSFAKKYFPELAGKVVVYDVLHRAKDKFQKMQELETHEIYGVDRQTLDALIMDQINQGKNVYLAYGHKHELVDKKTGIMSISAFNIPLKMLPLPLNRRTQFKIDDGGHAVHIVGYDVDPLTGELIKVKIKNSWGEKSGDLGYYHMYRDYLHTFVKRIVTTPWV